MRKITSYSIANMNMASGSIPVGQTVNINCPLDATGRTPVALLFQSTDWLDVYVYSSGKQVSLFHVNGMMPVICPNDITKISIENRHGAAAAGYYATPLDSAPDNNACYRVFNNNVYFSNLTSSTRYSFNVPLNAAGNKPEYLMFQAKGNVKYTFDLDPSLDAHNHGASFMVLDGQTMVVSATGAASVIVDRVGSTPALSFVTPLD